MKRKKKSILDNSNSTPYFFINKDRYEINKLESLPRPSLSIYTKEPIYSRTDYQDTSCSYIPDPLEWDLKVKQSKCWSL